MSEDQDLNKLKNAMKVEASELDLHRWKNAVRTRQTFLQRQSAKPWFQWMVAASIGFVVGAATFSQVPKNLGSSEKISLEDATFEQISIKDY